MNGAIPQSLVDMLNCNAFTPETLDPAARPFLHLTIPKDHQSKILDLESLLDAPDAKRGKFKFHTTDSLISYVDKHKSPQTMCFADSAQRCFEVIFETHSSLDASWHSHRASFAPRHSLEWNAWIVQDGKGMQQADFAEFIEANLIDIVQPSHADMMELALTFSAKSNIQFSRVIRLDNNTEQVEFNETVNATVGAKQTAKVPKKFILDIPVFEGGPKVKVPADFRYKVQGQSLVMGYKLTRPERLVTDEFEKIAEKIGKTVGKTNLLYGSAPVNAAAFAREVV